REVARRNHRHRLALLRLGRLGHHERSIAGMVTATQRRRVPRLSSRRPRLLAHRGDFMTQVPPPASTTPVTTSTPLQLAPAPAPAPPPVPVVLPANILASATSVLKQAQNAAHAVLAIAAAIVVTVEATVETLHQFNID